MPTPAYQGPGQPSSDTDSGLLGRLGSIFGTPSPTYLGDGQPSQSSGLLGRSTPAYLPAPTAPSDEPSIVDVTDCPCPIDPAALATGHIAIVIPRNCGPDSDADQNDK